MVNNKKPALMLAVLTAVMALLATATATAQPTQPPQQWREGEVIVLLSEGQAAARLSSRARQQAPASARRLQRMAAPAADQTPLGRAMARLQAAELLPIDQPLTMPSRRKAANAATSPAGQLIGAPLPPVPEPEWLSRLYLLRYKATDIAPDEAAAMLAGLDEVERAEPNLVFRIQPTGADSVTTVSAAQADLQWGLHAVGMPLLWQQPIIKDLRPVIAIIDTGVDTTHPDLAPNIYEEGYDFPRDTTDIIDLHGHGTHCAGIAAATASGQVTGACPEALIMPITVMDAQGSGSVFNIMLGVVFAVRHGAHIISMSLGAYGESSLYKSIVALATRNCFVFAAAGNDGICMKPEHRDLHGVATPHRPCIPGSYDQVMAVMSTDEDGRLSSFSNFDCDGPLLRDSAGGPNYELRCPGRQILSTLPGGTYGYLSGTSMACPMAAGIFARLCLSGRWPSPDRLKRTLVMTQGDHIDPMAALTADTLALEADTFRHTVGGTTYTFCRLDSATVQMGDGTQPAVSPAGDDTQLTLPDEVHGLTVTTLAPHALEGCARMAAVSLGRNLRSIGSQAFSGCDALANLYTATDTPPQCDATAFTPSQQRRVTLHVANGFTAPFAATAPWSSFNLHEQDLTTGNRFKATVGDRQLPMTFIIYNLENQIAQVGDGEPAIDTATKGDITIPDEVRSLRVLAVADDAFKGCTALTSVGLPTALQQIWSGAFRNCSSLRDVSLPASVNYIGTRAYQGCSRLRTLRLSPALTTISAFAFAECVALETIEAPMTEPPSLPESAFISDAPILSNDFDLEKVSKIYDHARLIVPYGCRARYATAPGWQLFRHIEESLPNAVATIPAAQPSSSANIYSLTGQRLTSTAPLPPGLYIQGGRKIIIK